MSEKQLRWANYLAQFHFTIMHTPGKQNKVADALSRRPQINAISTAYHTDLTTLKDLYATDEDFHIIWNQLQHGDLVPSYVIKEGFLFMQNKLCVTKELRNKVMEECHVPPFMGHRGILTTTQAMENYFFWPSMRKDIKKYVSECLTCQKVKFDRHKPAGLLQPLPIPNIPWESIANDFIFGLPKSANGHDGIWTIIDRFSKQAHFIPVKKNINAEQIARLFIQHIFKNHGLPQSIIGDRDPRTTSLFWRALFDNLVTKLKFSSAYHPQTDGQSEIANLSILDMLKCYAHETQTQWEKYLPLVEFAYNNIVHSSTGKAPFEIIYGKPLLLPIMRTKEEIFHADEFVHTAFSQVKSAIEKSQGQQKKAADKHRRNVEFKKGDWVLLKFDKARLRKTKINALNNPTLSPRYYGPFEITEKINDVSFRLGFPDHWRIHNAFHASLLKTYVGPPREEPVLEDPPEVEEQEEILQPEQIVFHSIRKRGQ